MRVLLAVAAATLALAAPAQAKVTFVAMEHSSFTPAHVDVLTGDAVSWRNGSIREHEVASLAVPLVAPPFDSGRVGPGGTFANTFDTPGVYPYFCRLHDGMRGEVAVHGLLLTGPRGVVARGAPVALQVRAPVGVGAATIEEDTGGGFRAVATARLDADGSLHATIRPPASASYRAVSGDRVSPSLRIEVTDEATVAVTQSHGVFTARAVPAHPAARLVFQVRLRERFGWWTVARRRLSARSLARFVPHRRRAVRARVALVGADWVTVLAASKPFVVGLSGR
jgi:plastocyanin